jgi:2-polyprenyl-6-methoxyphenol hydroxylase-like FAD-dependent oxidoreductase
MGMHWGLPFLTSILPPDLSTRLVTATIDPSIPPGPDCHLQSINGATGAVLADFPVGTWYRLQRRALRALLASGLAPDAIKYGYKLASYTLETADDGSPAVLARFANSEEVRGRLLVGADGASSVVRTLLLGEPKAKIVPMPFSALFVQSRYDASTAACLREKGGLYLNAIHPTGMVGWWGVHDVADPQDPASWTLYFNISFRTEEPQSGDSNGETVLFMQEQSEKAAVPMDEKAAAMRENLAKLREIGSTFCEPWKTASAALEQGTQCWQMKFGTWDPGEEGHRWDGKGVVTLAGDAAHAMTYREFSCLFIFPLRMRNGHLDLLSLEIVVC